VDSTEGDCLNESIRPLSRTLGPPGNPTSFTLIVDDGTMRYNNNPSTIIKSPNNLYTFSVGSRGEIMIGDALNQSSYISKKFNIINNDKVAFPYPSRYATDNKFNINKIDTDEYIVNVQEYIKQFVDVFDNAVILRADKKSFDDKIAECSTAKTAWIADWDKYKQIIEAWIPGLPAGPVQITARNTHDIVIGRDINDYTNGKRTYLSRAPTDAEKTAMSQARAKFIARGSMNVDATPFLVAAYDKYDAFFFKLAELQGIYFTLCYNYTTFILTNQLPLYFIKYDSDGYYKLYETVQLKKLGLLETQPSTNLGTPTEVSSIRLNTKQITQSSKLVLTNLGELQVLNKTTNAVIERINLSKDSCDSNERNNNSCAPGFDCISSDTFDVSGTTGRCIQPKSKLAAEFAGTSSSTIYARAAFTNYLEYEKAFMEKYAKVNGFDPSAGNGPAVIQLMTDTGKNNLARYTQLKDARGKTGACINDGNPLNLVATASYRGVYECKQQCDDMSSCTAMTYTYNVPKGGGPNCNLYSSVNRTLSRGDDKSTCYLKTN
jgi:hypothetical protein